MTLPGWDLLPPMLRGALVAAAVTLAVAGIARLARRPAVAAAAAGLGLALGFAAVLGVISASPRQLAERLPLLAILALAAGVVAAARHRVVAAVGVGLGLLAGAWWMAGAPLHPSHVLRALPVALGLLAAMALAWWRGAAALPMALAWAALAGGLAAAAARGPQVALALAGFAAVAAAALLRGGFGPASRLPVAVTLVAVAAVPLVARAAPADIAAAAAPALALLAGPALARYLPRSLGAWLGPVLAAAPAVGLALLLA